MPGLGEQETRDVAAKLRVTAALLGCASQKELCAAFRQANPSTEFDLGRSYKWIQGRSLPRSPRVYVDWAGVLGMDGSADWIASCTLDAFVEALCSRHAVDRMALLRHAGLDNGRGAAGAAEDYLCGAYACYSLAQSPYYGGRLIRSTLTIEPAARRAEGLVATYSQTLATGRAHATGTATVAGRGLALGLVSHSPGAAPLFLQLLLPTPPASLILGLMGGFVMVDPGGQPPYATRVLMLRTPIPVAALEESNRYLDEPDAVAALARDLPALGLRVADAEGLAAALARSLVPEGADGAPPGSMRVCVEDYRALAAACDRVWLDTLAANGAHAGPMAIRRPVAAPDNARRAIAGAYSGRPCATTPSPRAPARDGDPAATLETAGRLPEALEARRAAVLRAPKDAAARIAFGCLLLRMGRAEEAVAALRAAVGLAPGQASAHRALGSALGRLRRVSEAEAAFRAAMLLAPDDARVGNDLGALLAQQGRHAEAAEAFRGALACDPRSADALANLCASLGSLNRVEEAYEAGQSAVRLRPDHANAWANFGVLLARLGRPADAATACSTAIRLRPDHANAHANLGLALGAQGRFQEAIAALRQAIRIAPDHHDARKNLAMTLLLLGHLAEGFAEYEHRLPPRPAGLSSGAPRWRGESLAGGTILLHAEQGLGDTIQFVRYVPEVARRSAGRVLLAAPPLFARLLAGLPGLHAIVRAGEPAPPAHAQCALLSLPHALGTTLESVPAPIPYLRAEPDALARWRERLACLPGLRVGLAWAGNPDHGNDHNRSIALPRLAPLWAVPGVSWVSLQVGAHAGALRDHAPDGAVLDLAPALTDFAETAAAMAQLDLVVTVDTAVAHLAGALGRPVWTMLPALPDWRWLLGREDTPWYSSMRLFRQAQVGEWEGVVARVAAGVAALARERG